MITTLRFLNNGGLKGLMPVMAYLLCTAWLVAGAPQRGWAQTTRAVVANSGDNSVSIFNLSDGFGVAITNASDADCNFDDPRWVAVTRNGRFAAVTNGGGDTVTWIDLSTSPPDCLGATTVGSAPRGIAIRGNDRALVAINGGSDPVKVIDITGLPTVPDATDILCTHDLGSGANPQGVAITPHGLFALVAETGNDRVRYVDLATCTLLAGSTPVGAFPFGVAVTPGSNTALVTNRSDDTLSIIDISGLPAVPAAADDTIDVSDAPQGVAITSDGEKAVIAEAGTSDSATILRLSDLLSVGVPLGSNPFGVAISITPDSSKAAITNEGDDTVSILNLGTHAVDMTVIVGNAPRGIAITPVQPPIAKFIASPRKAVKPPLTANFINRSKDVDGQVVGFEWNLGDGTTSTLENPTHTYTTTGIFEVTLVVTDDDGAVSKPARRSINVGVNLPPWANFSPIPKKGTAPLAVRFLNKSIDPDGTIVGFSWNFGDGTTSTAANPTHTYTQTGIFEVTLVVTDDNGAVSEPREFPIIVK